MAGLAEQLVADARAVGMNVSCDGDELVLGGWPGQDELAAQLLDAKEAVLPYLEKEFEQEVAWRYHTISPQIPLTGPLPVLVARDAEAVAGTCLSCGEPVAEKRRCRACLLAIDRALDEIEVKRQSQVIGDET